MQTQIIISLMQKCSNYNHISQASSTSPWVSTTIQLLANTLALDPLILFTSHPKFNLVGYNLCSSTFYGIISHFHTLYIHWRMATTHISIWFHFHFHAYVNLESNFTSWSLHSRPNFNLTHKDFPKKCIFLWICSIKSVTDWNFFLFFRISHRLGFFWINHRLDFLATIVPTNSTNPNTLKKSQSSRTSICTSSRFFSFITRIAALIPFDWNQVDICIK